MTSTSTVAAVDAVTAGLLQSTVTLMFFAGARGGAGGAGGVGVGEGGGDGGGGVGLGGDGGGAGPGGPGSLRISDVKGW